MLSSGELRKMHIAKLLLSAPKVLILESPFIGLDAPSRRLLIDLLQHLIDEATVQIILVVSAPQDIPAFVTHVYEVDNMRCSRKFPLQEYRAQETITARRAAINNRHIELPVLPEGNGEICTAEEIVRLENVSIRYGSRTIIDRLNWTVKNGEKWSLSGPNGAGKSLLVDMLTEKYPLRDGELTYDFSPSLTKTAYDNIKYIAFRDTYGSADANYYYQQRWNAHDQEDAPLVREVLGEVKDDILRRQLFELFSIEPMLDKKIILLSSGELRRFQLTKALLTVPRILIMDNPFIGLDAPTRELLFNLLERLTRLGELQIVLVLSMLDDIPSFITHVVPVEDMKVGEKMEREEYVQAFCAGNQMRIQEEAGALEELQRCILDLPYEHANFTSDEVVKLNGVSIRYDDRTILKELDWTVMRGEKWALSGENGAGKSTLLSLVCADNPQSYACDISLFGRKRGTGESIWEIKKHIGYVSPEMHRAYLKNLPAIEIVASGLHDSIGLYKRPHAEQMSVCEWWMEIFGIAALKDSPFLQLSSGEQRLALLARAFVKDPELLILDEPLHGLDTYNRRRVKKIIEAFCHRRDKTMIMVTHYENELPQTITNRLFLKRNR